MGLVCGTYQLSRVVENRHFTSLLWVAVEVPLSRKVLGKVAHLEWGSLAHQGLAKLGAPACARWSSESQ